MKFLTEVQCSVVDFVFSLTEEVLHWRWSGLSALNWRWRLIEVNICPIIKDALAVKSQSRISTAGYPIVSEFRCSVCFTSKEIVNVTFIKKILQLWLARQLKKPYGV